MTEMTTAAPATRTAPPTARDRRLARLSAVLALVVFALASSASPAAAYTESKSTYAGYVGVPRATGLVYQNSLGTIGPGTKAIRMPRRVVGESEAYGNRSQWICQTTRLWGLNSLSNWAVVTSDRRCGWITAGQVGTLVDAFDFTNLSYDMAYNVDVTTTWRLGDNTLIAKSFIDYTHVGDYSCSWAYCHIARSDSVGAFLWFSR
jgi:hypothetical protein